MECRLAEVIELDDDSVLVGEMVAAVGDGSPPADG
jgi:flavin reductase (DIM6/NTAB) family NADH-FMN oxidoreductase RutF